MATVISVAGVITESSQVSASSRSVVASANSQSVSANGGGSFTVTAGVPVAAPGTVSQSITMAFDPTRANVTGANGIVAPTGWSLTFSSDGTTFGAAPGSPSGWAAIRAIRATGSIQSGGDSSGLQIATGSGTVSVPPSSVFNAGGGGDGWDVAFDEQGNVYNTFHHDGYWGSGFITPGLHCHTRSGASCGPGWPFALRVPHGTTGPDGLTGQPWYHTNDQSMQWVDVLNNRIWIPTNLNDGTAASGTGFVCVDVSNLSVGPSWCGGGIRNAFVKLGPTLCLRDCALGLAASNGKLFAWDASTGSLMCLNTSGNRPGSLPGAPCSSQPYSFTSITTTNHLDGYSLMEAQGLIWGSSNGYAVCFNPANLSACAGWSSGGVALTGTFPNTMFDVPASNGATGAVCFARYSSSRGCFSADGSSNSLLTGSHAGSGLMSYLVTRLSTQILPKSAVTTGTKVIWADGMWPGGGKVYCFDTSLSSGAGAACPNWPVNVSAYTATIDSQNSNCVWTNTDDGTISTIDVITGASTCTTPPSVGELSAPVVVPRLACTNSNSIQQWRSFKLTSPASSAYTSASLTVLSDTGAILSGWNRVPISGPNRTVDLSTLNVQTSGLSPRFKVSLTDKTGTDVIGGDVTVVGDSPQLCVPLQAVSWCPSGPARVVGAMMSPSAITVSVSGEAQPSSGPAEVFNTATTAVAVSSPSDSSCLGTINGAATMASTSLPVESALVRLLSSTGSIIATTTTDSAGNYSFSRLIAGSSYRVEFGPSTQGAADANTVSSTTTNRSVTVNNTTTVNGVYALLRTNALSGSGLHGQSVVVTPAPHDSNGTQSYTGFTKSATCIVDPVDNVCKGTVAISGEGIWSTDVNNGSLSFAPTTGYSGATTAVAYRVTETTSSLTTWNLVSVVIATPTSVPPPSSNTANSPSVVIAPTTTVPASSSNVVISSSVITRAAATGALVSRVRVTVPGRVTQTGTTRLNGRTIPAVTCQPVTVRRASTVNVRCDLTWAVRQALRRSGVSVYVLTKIVPKSGKTVLNRTVVKLKKLMILPSTR